MEYVTITEAARRCGMSKKTICSAIRDGKLATHYSKSNRYQIAVDELEIFKSGYLEIRLVELEKRVKALERLVDRHLGKLSQLKVRRNRRPKHITSSLTQGFVPLSDFAKKHCVSEGEVLTAYEMGLLPVECGEWIDKNGMPVTKALDMKGRQVFYQLYHGVPPFVACEQCPHDDRIAKIS